MELITPPNNINQDKHKHVWQMIQHGYQYLLSADNAAVILPYPNRPTASVAPVAVTRINIDKLTNKTNQ